MRSAAMLAAAVLFCGAAAADQAIPFKMLEISGPRPVVTILVNGRKYHAMIHANAGPYLQINHAQAKAVKARGMAHKDSYGIVAPGKVSALGRDTAVIDRLAVNGVVDRDVPVSVFEKPTDVAILGLPWITWHGLVMDYPRSQAIVPDAPDSAAKLRARLLATGYTAHAMRLDPKDGRYLVTVAVGKVPASFVVSTVAEATLDTAFARRAGIAKGKMIDTYGGPSGATGEVFETKEPVVLSVGRFKAKARKLPIEDTYAYMKAPRPANPRGGMIGADFLIAHQAVVDFGAKTLYLK
jgi:hypothetical protein